MQTHTPSTETFDSLGRLRKISIHSVIPAEPTWAARFHIKTKFGPVEFFKPVIAWVVFWEQDTDNGTWDGPYMRGMAPHSGLIDDAAEYIRLTKPLDSLQVNAEDMDDSYFPALQAGA